MKSRPDSFGNQGKSEYRLSVLFTLCTKSINLSDEVDCMQRLILTLILSWFIVIFFGYLNTRSQIEKEFIYFLHVFSLFLLYML